jgi:hypothetical protein
VTGLHRFQDPIILLADWQNAHLTDKMNTPGTEQQKTFLDGKNFINMGAIVCTLIAANEILQQRS